MTAKGPEIESISKIMMRSGKEPVEGIGVESKSERLSSLSSSVIDTGSDFIEPSISLESTNEINGNHVREPGSNEECDREAILRQLVNCGNSEADHQMILDLIRSKIRPKTQDTNISTESYEFSEDKEMSDQDRQKSLVDGLRESLKAVPDSMMHFLTGWFRPGDCERPSDQKPEWLDIGKIRRGQKFVQDHMFSVIYSQLLGVFAIFTFEDELNPIIISGNSSTPPKAFRRYLSTILRLRHWYTQDSWTKGTDAWKDILVVRSMHAATTRRLKALTNEEIDAAAIIPNAYCPAREILLKDFSETCEIPLVGQCPHLVSRNNPNRPKSITQTEMAVTQWSFVSLIILFPESFGIRDANEEDIEAYCHLWRSIGYQLGMEDEYNLCRGTLDEIRQRNRDLLDTWVKPNFREITPEWEHMGRCLVTSMAVLVPLATYETTLLNLMEIIDLKMPRLYASLSYKDWIIYNSLRFFFHHAVKLPGISGLMNTAVNLVLDRAEKFTPKQIEDIRIKLSN